MAFFSAVFCAFFSAFSGLRAITQPQRGATHATTPRKPELPKPSKPRAQNLARRLVTPTEKTAHMLCGSGCRRERCDEKRFSGGMSNRESLSNAATPVPPCKLVVKPCGRREKGGRCIVCGPAEPERRGRRLHGPRSARGMTATPSGLRKACGPVEITTISSRSSSSSRFSQCRCFTSASSIEPPSLTSMAKTFPSAR